MIPHLLDVLDGDSMQRLRWRVLREFNILPGSSAALELSDKDIVLAGLNMLLDLGRRPSSDSEYMSNPHFSSKQFDAIRKMEDES